jgi:Tol biopolymer transport system component
MRFFTLILSTILSGAVYAQTTNFDVYIGDLSLNKQGLLTLSNITALTDRAAYDNQPLFLPDGNSLLYTSASKDGDDEQMDSFVYRLDSARNLNLTNTSISEYSPTLMPNGRDFSVIRGIGEIQKLWRYPLNTEKGEAPSELLKDVNPVGYHAWIDKDRVILFVLGEPHTLQLADLRTQKASVLDKDIGASLYKIPGTELMSYTASLAPIEDENQTQTWQLKSYDPATAKVEVLAQLPEGAYYYGWSADGKALAAVGTKLKQWDSLQPNKGWLDFADVGQPCPGGVTRLTTNQQNTKLAFVCTR